jgi:hypothetical protein
LSALMGGEEKAGKVRDSLVEELETCLARAKSLYERARRAGFKADGTPGSALYQQTPESFEREIAECERMLEEARAGLKGRAR